MIVYRDVTVREGYTAALARARRHLRGRDPLAALVEIGELEQAVVDARSPSRDGWGEPERRLRCAALAAGAAFVRAPDVGGPGDALRALEPLDRSTPPSPLHIRLPEGYGHYALDPAAYAASARRYVADAGPEVARRAVVIGVRSIGTSLSAVVAATVGSARSFTIRPRGPSGGRSVALGPALRALLREWLRDRPDVLVVDEGPGVTGETFACVARWLRAEGVPDSRLILFPSHDGAMPIAPESRHEWFRGARKYLPPPDGGRPERVADGLGLDTPIDLSAGGWRARLPGAAGNPARPGFERLKYLTRDATGSAVVLRYVGLGRWGEEAVGRAVRLSHAERGSAVESPHAGDAADGFVALRWAEGRPLRRRETSSRAFVAALTEYLIRRAGRFRTGTAVDPEPLEEVLVANATDAYRRPPVGLSAAARRLAALPRREAVVADARLQPWEWVRSARDGRIAKVDVLDHGDGLRVPGPADAAWDLAGAAVEYGLEGGTLDILVTRCARAFGESPRHLADAVSAHRAPYAAAALGDADLSAREVSSPEDRERLRREARFYAGRLREELRRAAAV